MLFNNEITEPLVDTKYILRESTYLFLGNTNFEYSKEGFIDTTRALGNKFYKWAKSVLAWILDKIKYCKNWIKQKLRPAQKERDDAYEKLEYDLRYGRDIKHDALRKIDKNLDRILKLEPDKRRSELRIAIDNAIKSRDENIKIEGLSRDAYEFINHGAYEVKGCSVLTNGILLDGPAIITSVYNHAASLFEALAQGFFFEGSYEQSLESLKGNVEVYREASKKQIDKLYLSTLNKYHQDGKFNNDGVVASVLRDCEASFIAFRRDLTIMEEENRSDRELKVGREILTIMTTMMTLYSDCILKDIGNLNKEVTKGLSLLTDELYVLDTARREVYEADYIISEYTKELEKISD